VRTFRIVLAPPSRPLECSHAKLQYLSWRTASSSNRQCSAPGIGPSLLSRAAITTSTLKTAQKRNRTKVQNGHTLLASAAAGKINGQWAQPTVSRVWLTVHRPHTAGSRVRRGSATASGRNPLPYPVGATHCSTRVSRTVHRPHYRLPRQAGKRDGQWAQPTAVPAPRGRCIGHALPAPKSGGEARRPVGATHCRNRATRTVHRPHTAGNLAMRAAYRPVGATHPECSLQSQPGSGRPSGGS
jgi:hypothetical protein